jgi:hypothetical protein
MAEKQWQVVNKKEITEKWPLHSLVFENKSAQLSDTLKENKVWFLSSFFYLCVYVWVKFLNDLKVQTSLWQMYIVFMFTFIPKVKARLM